MNINNLSKQEIINLLKFLSDGDLDKTDISVMLAFRLLQLERGNND